jgi:CheY-like chemotaxis protein
MRILVIDDDEKIREMIGLILAGEGHELLDASNGNEGLKLLEKHAS